MKNNESKVITKNGALWHVIWGCLITELTVACVIAEMIVMALSYGGWGIYAAICAVMALLILLLIGVVFR